MFKEKTISEIVRNGLAANRDRERVAREWEKRGKCTICGFNLNPEDKGPLCGPCKKRVYGEGAK